MFFLVKAGDSSIENKMSFCENKMSAYRKQDFGLRKS